MLLPWSAAATAHVQSYLDEANKGLASFESIKYFRPTGEPDADWDTYKDNV